MKKAQNVTLDVRYILEIKKRGIPLSPLLNELLGKYLGLEEESEDEKRQRVVKDIQEEEDLKEALPEEVNFLIDTQIRYRNKQLDQGATERYTQEFNKDISLEELDFKIKDLKEKAERGVKGFESAQTKYPNYYK